MATGTQVATIKRTSDNAVLYTVTTRRDTSLYPLTNAGDSAMATAIAAGLHTLLVDNGAVIPIGTIPPLTKPSAPILPTPSGLTATVASATQINLSWQSVQGATAYQIERSLTGSSGWEQIATPSATSYNNTGLTGSTTYYYRVRATSTSGTSAYSSDVSATTNNAVVQAFSQRIQAENATGSGTYLGSVGDGTTRGPYTTSAEGLVFTVTGAPVTASNYTIAIRYQTNFDTGATGEMGQMGVIINGGSTQHVATEGAAGGYRTMTLTGQTLNTGNNSIRIEGSFRTFFLDYIEVTRQASS